MSHAKTAIPTKKIELVHMNKEEMKRYNTLFCEFQDFLNRPLTMKEKNFLKWIVKKKITVEELSKNS
ncbi:hypothetical protein [Bacillus taeanensis]|uniref:Uncharacterized protein n=1 Tax=Bacillus taeanensis TaxID=273032 RepID=A0A366XQ96_9BACI|nr:hypothetical protein [Bacillus taeanensis]RBW68087.1 hypothetical protein DS031_18600 [Bacillus taeanensis]